MRWCSSVIVLLALLLAGCTVTPPPGWQKGGQPLRLGPVRWVNGDIVIDVDEEGTVLVGGKHLYGIDRAGRVYDAYDRPVAILDPEGYVTGTDDDAKGWVGGYEAYLPGGEGPWLRLHRGGLLLRYDDDAEGRPFGMWVGCDDPQVMQTCTLVSHLVGLELRRRQQQARPRIGVGIGVGVGFGP